MNDEDDNQAEHEILEKFEQFEQLLLESKKYNYFIDDLNIRHVIPYWRKYIINVKNRMLNKNIIDILVNEHGRLNKMKWLHMIKNKQIFLKSNKHKLSIINLTTQYHKLNHGEQIIIFEHGHEPKVYTYDEDNNRIISENEHILAVNKSASIPMHSCGPYYKNTMKYILELNYKHSLKVVHRLDRLTSGLCFFAKSKISAQILNYIFTNKKVQKIYITRVHGNFQFNNHQLSSLSYINESIKDKKDNATYSMEIFNHLKLKDDDTILNFFKEPVYIINTPIYILRNYNLRHDINRNKDVCNITAIANKMLLHKQYNLPIRSLDAITYIQKIAYDQQGNTSLLLCSPITGRPHQIRAHLELIKYPICNDPFHSGKLYKNNTIKRRKISSSSSSSLTVPNIFKKKRL